MSNIFIILFMWAQCNSVKLMSLVTCHLSWSHAGTQS